MTGRAYGGAGDPRGQQGTGRRCPRRGRGRQGAVVGAQSSVSAATASISRIEADIPRQRTAVSARRTGSGACRATRRGAWAGGRVLNLLDLSDVYITFFLPETVAGRVARWARRFASFWMPRPSM